MGWLASLAAASMSRHYGSRVSASGRGTYLASVTVNSFAFYFEYCPIGTLFFFFLP